MYKMILTKKHIKNTIFPNTSCYTLLQIKKLIDSKKIVSFVNHFFFKYSQKKRERNNIQTINTTCYTTFLFISFLSLNRCCKRTPWLGKFHVYSLIDSYSLPSPGKFRSPWWIV